MSNQLKKVLLTSAAAGVFSFSNSAQAACNTDTANQWECIQVNGIDQTGNGVQGPFYFSGTSAFSVGFISASCTLSLETTVDVDTATNRAYINVSSVTLSGAGVCNDLNYSGFTWQINEAGSATTLGIQGTNGGDISPPGSDYAMGDLGIITVSHSTFGTLCNGELQGVTFRNNPAGGAVSDHSELDISGAIPGTTFLGNCTVNANLKPGAAVDIW